MTMVYLLLQHNEDRNEDLSDDDVQLLDDI